MNVQDRDIAKQIRKVVKENQDLLNEQASTGGSPSKKKFHVNNFDQITESWFDYRVNADQSMSPFILINYRHQLIKLYELDEMIEQVRETISNRQSAGQRDLPERYQISIDPSVI